MKTKAPLLFGAALAMAACSETMPPKELIDARAAFNHAAAGPAQALDPAELHVAESQLETAEHSFDKNGDTFQTRDLAYVAERKAELAETRANVVDYDQEVNLAERQVTLNQAQALGQAQAQLEATRQQLAATTAAMDELKKLRSVQNVRKEPRGMVITLSGSVLFASGKYDLLPSAQETLGNVAHALSKASPESKIVVQGYTDSQGSLGYNETLSQNRAESVRAFLISHGIPMDRVSAVGFGPANPIADNNSPEGRANNRRVEIVVQPPSGNALTPAPGSEEEPPKP